MIFVENELLHVNEADTEAKGKSVNAKGNAKGKSVNAKDNAKGKGKGRDNAKDNAKGKPKSQPKTRKRQIEDLAIDDAALVLVDEEEEGEGLLIQKI